MLEHNITRLFSVPIYQSTEPYEISDDELEFIKSLEVTEKEFVSPSANFNILDSEELFNIKKYIERHLENYVYEILKISKDISFYFTESWVNYMPKGGCHPQHIHPNSIVSGVFFIHGNPCPINFVQNKHYPFSNFQLSTTEKNVLNSNTFEFYNHPGVLLLFPSDTPHTVFENTSDFVRVSLSFNTFIKGKISDNPSTALSL